MEKKIDLILGYECNLNCIFCYAADKRGKYPSMTTEEAIREMVEGRRRGCTIIDFNGGEPTIRKDIIQLVSIAKELGYREVAITTNGQMFSYRKFTRRIIEAGLDHVVLSIHGHEAWLHEIHTRVKGSFRRLMRGIENLKEEKPDIYLASNTVITKFNYKYLPRIAENNINLGIKSLEFIFPHPRGNALKYFNTIVPTLTQLAPYVSPTIEVGRSKGVWHTFFRYLPLCYIFPNIKYSSELFERRVMRQEHVGPEFKDLSVERGRIELGKTKGEQCKGCKYYRICEGLWKEYVEKRGVGELIPV